MKKIMKKKYFYPFAVVFLLMITALGVQMTYGAYMRRSYVKAVIATNETEKLFGSNLLYGVKNQPINAENDDWLSVYPYSTSVKDGETSITVPIKIYNYLAEDQDRVNQLDVSYQISFKISGNPTMTDGKMTNYSVNGQTISEKETVYYLGTAGLTKNKNEASTETLPGRLPNMNEYKITIPGSDLGKVSIAVKAARVPNATGNFGTDLLYLAARVVPSLPSTVQMATVKGSFAYNTGEIPKDYAAYNYSIELSGAPTAVLLSWNSELLEIDPFFEEKFGVQPDGNQVIFNMEPGITKVQFYRKGNVEGKDWNDLGVTVSER